MFSVVAFAFTKKPAVWSLDRNIEIKTMRTSIGLKLIDLSQHRFHSCKCKVCMIKDNLPVKNIVEDENHITLKINRFHINYFLTLHVHKKPCNWKACCLHRGNFQIEDRSSMFVKVSTFDFSLNGIHSPERGHTVLKSLWSAKSLHWPLCQHNSQNFPSTAVAATYFVDLLLCNIIWIKFRLTPRNMESYIWTTKTI